MSLFVLASGRATLKSWSGKDGELRTGLSVVAERVMSAHQAKKPRPAAPGAGDDGWVQQ